MKKFTATASIAVLVSSALCATSQRVVCEGSYPYHLQGVATDCTNIYWTFTTVLVKTDLSGKIITKTEIGNGHMGDLCFKDGKVFIGMNFGKNGTGERKGDEVWVYDAESFALDKKYPTPEPAWCNNGLEWFGSSFWVITSTPRHSEYNYLYEYSPDFKFKTCVLVKSGWTNLGVQTICRFGDAILLGCYGTSDDTVQPHKSCTIRIDGKQLLNTAHVRGKGPAEIVWRKDVNTAEGMLVLEGAVWEAHSMLLSAEGGKRLWTAQMFPSQGLRKN